MLVGTCGQGIAELNCLIRIGTNLVDWIMIDNPKSKLDFGLSIHFFHFNPNSKMQIISQEIKFQGALCFNQKSQAILIHNFQKNG